MSQWLRLRELLGEPSGVLAAIVGTHVLLSILLWGSLSLEGSAPCTPLRGPLRGALSPSYSLLPAPGREKDQVRC